MVVLMRLTSASLQGLVGLEWCLLATKADAAGCEQTHTRIKADTKLIDATNPIGEITVKENKRNSFINTITFNIFCKDKYDVTITANDNESGIASVEYLLFEAAISESDIVSVTGWKSYGAFSIKDDGEYIIYAKILDKAGNVTYLSSDGLVLDDDKEYMPVQKVVRNLIGGKFPDKIFRPAGAGLFDNVFCVHIAVKQVVQSFFTEHAAAV